MNLTKWFSKNYSIQNLKKSKGALAIMLVIIPVITLFCLYNYDNSIFETPYEVAPLIVANIVGMFVIPFILSNVLLGYVYKRNSIDFVNAMPITRKKIYLSNMITGIIYLILLQVINFIILAFYLLIVEISFISMKMLVDSFIIMTVAYIFMFIISSLALTISGNKFIQIVLVMLILFLLPFIRVFNLGAGYNVPVEIDAFEGTANFQYITKTTIFTLPINIFYTLMEKGSIYSLNSILYTLVIGLIYIFLGVKLFERRKMENTGSSFESTKIHLFVKLLTLYPMIRVLEYIHNSIDIPELILIIFLIFVYYFIYDLITSKKVKLKITIISFICSSVVLYGVIVGLDAINKNLLHPIQEVSKDDIAQVDLDLGMFYNYERRTKLSANVENREIVDFILDNYKTDYFSNNGVSIGLKLKLENGDIVDDYGYMSRDVFRELLKKLGEEKQYIKKLAEENKIEDEIIIKLDQTNKYKRLKSNDRLVQTINDNMEKYFENKIKAQSNNKNYLKYYSNNYIIIYRYKNHQRQVLRMELDDLPELEKEYMKMINAEVENTILEYEKNSFKYSDSQNFSILKKNTENQSELGIYASSKEKDAILKFIKENCKNEVDPEKPYYTICDDIIDLVFFTNEVEKFEEFLKNNIDTNNFYDLNDTIEFKDLENINSEKAEINELEDIDTENDEIKNQETVNALETSF